ncbi:hypothetical protein [Tateyamaria sp.]|uniref:hypothetical protein n=1 Tax=Tateyamaria sp. TaxID=1929288 RepID=UPI003B214A9B
MPEVATALAALFGGGAFATALANVVVGIAVNALSAALQRNQSGSRAFARQDSRQRGAIVPQAFGVGGYATTGSDIMAPLAHDAKHVAGTVFTQEQTGQGRYITLIVALSDLPITRMNEVIVQGQRLVIGSDLVDSGDSYGMAIPEGRADGVEQFRGKLWVKFYDGTQTQADPMLLEVYGNHETRPFDAGMVFTGGAYAIVTLEHDSELWTDLSGIRFVLDGIKPNGTFTDNPMRLAAHLATGVTLPDGQVFTAGYASGDIDQDALNAAAAEVTAARFSCGLEIPVGTPDGEGINALDAIDQLLNSCAGSATDVGGQLYFDAMSSGLPVVHITDDDVDLSRSQTAELITSLKDKTNRVSITHPSPDENWAEKASPLEINLDAANADGEPLAQQISAPAINNVAQARTLSQMLIADSRKSRLHALPVHMALGRLRPKVKISYTSAYHGYAAKEFMVESVATAGGETFLTIRETDPNDFNPANVDLDPYQPVVPVVSVPVPLQPSLAVAPVEIGQNGGGISAGLRLTVANIPPSALGWNFEIRVAGQSDPVGGTASRHTLAVDVPLNRNTNYEARALYVSQTRASIWSDWIAATTPDVLLGVDDLAGDIAASITAAQATADLAAQDALAAHSAADDVLEGLDAAVASLTVDYSATQAAAQDAETAQTAAELAQSTAATHAATADGARGLAQTAQTAAELARDLASTAASTAQGHSDSAAASSSIAASVAQYLLPHDFEQDGSFWTHSISGDPALKSDWPHGSFVQTTERGKVARLYMPVSRTTHLAPKAYVKGVVGRKVKITFEARFVGTPPSGGAVLRYQFRSVAGDFSDLRGIRTVSNALPGDGSFATFSDVLTVSDESHAYILPFIYWAEADDPDNGYYDVSFIKIEDVTESAAAQSSADAAATSESQASAFKDDAQTASSASSAAKVAAEAARDSSQASASSSANSANSAAAAETAAGQSASAANIDRIAAQTARGGAETAQTAAAISATNAEGSANSASTSAEVTAQISRDQLPYDFQKFGSYWKTGFNGPPDGASDLSQGAEFSFIDDNDAGRILRMTTDGVGNLGFSPKGYLRIEKGRTYRTTVIARASNSAGDDPRLLLQNRSFSADYVSTGLVAEADSYLAKSDGWKELVVETTYSQVLKNEVWFSPFIYMASASGQNQAGDAIEIRSVFVRDVSDEYAAGQSASAAASSASAASASENAAGQSARSATTSANTASTRANVANTRANAAASSSRAAASSATDAAQSATSASGSANSASTSAGSASSSRTSAAQSATSASNFANAAAQSATVAATALQDFQLSSTDFQMILLDTSSITGIGAVEAIENGPAALGQSGTLVSATSSGDIITGGFTNGAYIEIPSEQALQFQGRRVRIDVLARPNVTNPAASFSVVYSTAESGNSGQSLHTLAPGWDWYSFYYTVPLGVAGGSDWIGLFGDATQTGKKTQFSRVLVRLASLAGDIPEIGVVQAQATITQAAVADLEGNAAASIVLRTQAGSSGAALELVSADDPDGPTSVARIVADNILLEGSVGTDMLTVGLGRNLLENSDFSNGLTGIGSWVHPAQSGETGLALRSPGSPWAGVNYPTLEIYQTGTVATGFAAVYLPKCSVEEGEWYDFSTKISTHRALSSGYMRFLADDGVTLVGSWKSIWFESSVSQGSSTNPEQWETRWGKFRAPVGAAYVEVFVRKLPTNSGASSYLFLNKPQIALTHEFATQPTPYSPGGHTLISGGKIITGSITADNLVANIITAGSGLIGDLAVDTLQIADQAVTVPARSYASGIVNVNSTSLVTVASVAIDRDAYATEVSFTCAVDGNFASSGGTHVTFEVFRDTRKLGEFTDFGDLGRQYTSSFSLTDSDTGTGVSTFYVKARKVDPSVSGGYNNNIRVFRRHLKVQQFKK